MYVSERISGEQDGEPKATLTFEANCAWGFQGTCETEPDGSSAAP